MTKERELIRDLVTLVEWVAKTGILRFDGDPPALLNAKQFLAAPPSTGNPVSGLEEDIDDLKIELRVAIDRQAKLNNEIHNQITKMHKDSDNLAERLSDLEEAAVEQPDHRSITFQEWAALHKDHNRLEWLLRQPYDDRVRVDYTTRQQIDEVMIADAIISPR